LAKDLAIPVQANTLEITNLGVVEIVSNRSIQIFEPPQ